METGILSAKHKTVDTILKEHAEKVDEIYNNPCNVPEGVKVSDSDMCSPDTYKQIYFWNDRMRQEDDPELLYVDRAKLLI